MLSKYENLLTMYLYEKRHSKSKRLNLYDIAAISIKKHKSNSYKSFEFCIYFKKPGKNIATFIYYDEASEYRFSHIIKLVKLIRKDSDYTEIKITKNRSVFFYKDTFDLKVKLDVRATAFFLDFVSSQLYIPIPVDVLKEELWRFTNIIFSKDILKEENSDFKQKRNYVKNKRKELEIEEKYLDSILQETEEKEKEFNDLIEFIKTTREDDWNREKLIYEVKKTL